jgi:putative addiction module killer protein
MKVVKTQEYEKWFAEQSDKIQGLIKIRLFRIQHYDYFGDIKYLNDRLSELRWKNELRIYFTRLDIRVVLLLYGGGKNGQKNDIKKAKILIQQYADSKT